MQKEEYFLKEGTGEAIVTGLRFYVSGETPASEAWKITVDAIPYQERCLILRIQQKEMDLSYLIFIDTLKKKPFAYFNLSENEYVRFPPVKYYDP